MGANLIVVISDLHVGAPPLDDCDEELERQFVGFIGELCAQGADVELVVNGDFLDFAQAAPWRGSELESESPLGVPLCFTEEQSVAKLESIIKAHAPVFEALGEFLRAKPANRVVILPGNHDADFFWTRVRTLFADAVCGEGDRVRDRLTFHLERFYLSPRCPRVWIEHGNQYDPINSFYVEEFDPEVGTRDGKKLRWSQAAPPILADLDSRPRLYECVGTRFLIRFMNQLDADYPFVDNVKPFSKFLTVFGMSALAGGYGPLKVSFAVYGMFRYLLGLGLGNASDFLGLEKEEGAPLGAYFSGVLESLSADDRKAFARKLSERGFKVEAPLTMYVQDAIMAERLFTFLSENLDLLDPLPPPHASSYLGVGDDSGYLSLARGFTVDETKELSRAAQKLIEQRQLDAVVMGHTHERVSPPASPRYFNTGSWTRYYNFGEKKLQPWSLLRENSYRLFPYQLNYAEISPERDDPVRMKTYSERTSG